MVRSTPTEVGKLIAELTRANVCSKGDDGSLLSRRMVKEAKRRAICRDNGSKGGSPLLVDKSDNPNGNHHARSLDKTQRLELEPKLDPEPEHPIVPRFDRFWDAYPRKVAKGAAQKAFEKLSPDEAMLAQMQRAIAWQINTPGWRKNGGEYIPHPATWINQRRWEDEVVFQVERHTTVVPDKYADVMVRDE